MKLKAPPHPKSQIRISLNVCVKLIFAVTERSVAAVEVLYHPDISLTQVIALSQNYVTEYFIFNTDGGTTRVLSKAVRRVMHDTIVVVRVVQMVYLDSQGVAIKVLFLVYNNFVN